MAPRELTDSPSMAFRITNQSIALLIRRPRAPSCPDVTLHVSTAQLDGDGRFSIELTDVQAKRYVCAWERDLCTPDAARDVTMILDGKEDLRFRNVLVARYESLEFGRLRAYFRFLTTY